MYFEPKFYTSFRSMQAMTTPVHLAYFGSGDNYHVQKWLPALARQDLRVTLLTFHPPPAPLDGVAVRHLRPPFRTSAKTMSWIDFCGPVRSLRRLIATLGVDVLMPSYATSYGWMGARTGFRPLLLNTWTYDVSVYPFEGLRRWLFRPVVGYVLRRAQAILTDGAALAGFIRSHYRVDPARVVPALWGPDLATFPFSPGLRPGARAAWHLPAGAPVVLSVRGVQDRYAPAQVLTAFQALLDAHPEVHVVVLTLGHARSEATRRRLADLAGHPRARIIDRFLDRTEMAAAWAAADVFVSVPPHDGISVSVLEGMYAGAIPVVSDIPSNRSFLKEGEQAFFVPPGDAGALAHTLLRILDALPRLRAVMAPGNHAWVRAHASVEATARQVADLVRRLARDEPLSRPTPYPATAHG
ncbi:MAG: hypothetical protein KatS3mg043_1784 [Rhodothermaceae bacterium]|nr:MAG: hypothetical protein KatS3mg043_1784 [Rhodothermaceae bacterium]